MKKIYFVRHGQSEENVTGVFTDGVAPLTKLGLQQAELVAQRLMSIPVDIVYSSKFTRAQQTANVITSKIGKKLEVLDFVHEYSHYGVEHLGKNRSEDQLVEHGKQVKAAWRNNELDISNGGETVRDVMQRIQQLVTFINESEYQDILVVAHENFFGKLLGAVLIEDYNNARVINTIQQNISMSNTGVTVFSININNEWKLEQWNDDAHLGELV